MPAEIVFSGGEAVEVPDGDAQILMQKMSEIREDPAPRRGRSVPTGWLAVETKDGAVYVNSAQVAYVRDKRERSKEFQTF